MEEQVDLEAEAGGGYGLASNPIHSGGGGGGYSGGAITSVSFYAGGGRRFV